jgi:hypothetical protein
VIPVEDVKHDDTSIEDLMGEVPVPEPEAAPEPEPEETPVEQKKRLITKHTAALAKIQECESALANAKREAGEIAKEVQKLTDVNLPLHELNRRAQEINRGEDDQRHKTREALAVLTAGQRPGVPTRPPLFNTGTNKQE